MLNDTIADQDLFAVAAEAPAALRSPEEALHAKNPGVGMISRADWAKIARELHLSAREFNVAVLLFEGNSRFQVAQRLKCSAATIRTYIDRLFAKLNVEDRLGMVLRVMRVHLTLLGLRRQPVMSHKNVTCMPE